MPTSPPAHSVPAPDFKAASLPHTDSLEVASLKASSSTTNVPEGLHTPHKGRWWLLALFSVANFIDIYAASGTVLAIPDVSSMNQISRNLGLTLPQSIWVISSYALAFAAMMLSAGRVADIWNAKYVFVIGLLWIGAFSIGLALVETPNGMIVLRALQGVGAAMTIPAATNLIVNLFPEPALQEIAIAIFGATGAFANVLGLVLGGLLLLASYEWIFYFTSIVTIPAAAVGFFLIPDLKRSKVDDLESSNAAPQVKAGKLDYLGTLSMTAAIALFVYGLTSANVDGWKSAASLSTIIIGFFMFGVFYWIETLPKNPDDALIPTSMWRIPNFALLSAMALVVPFWFFAIQSSLSERMQHLGASPLLVAARFLPMGFATLVAVAILQKTPLTVVPLRWRLLGGGSLAAVGALMISFAQEHISYWALLFPAFIIGAMGVGSLFLTLNIAIVMSVGPERAGVAGAVLNTLFQLGIAIGLAITTVLQVSYRGSAEELKWDGYRYSFLFVMAVELAAGILGFVFFKDPTVPEVAAEIEEKTRVQEVLPSL